MPSALASGLRSRAAGYLGSAVLFPPIYSVKQYIAEQGVRHDFRRLIALPDYPGSCLVYRNVYARITATGAWQKKWKH